MADASHKQSNASYKHSDISTQDNPYQTQNYNTSATTFNESTTPTTFSSTTYSSTSPTYNSTPTTYTSTFSNQENNFHTSAVYTERNNSFSNTTEEYNPEEEPETWENDSAWNQPPPVDMETPESPPHFEKKSCAEPVEYHDVSVIQGGVDVDHRVLPNIPSVSIKGTNNNSCFIHFKYHLHLN